jgi:hypothetical protein
MKGIIISAHLAGSLGVLPKITGRCCESTASSFCYFNLVNIGYFQ